MAKVNVTELRQNLPAYLVEVQKGKEIEVTSRGKVIARIVAGSAETRSTMPCVSAPASTARWATRTRSSGRPASA